MEICGLVIIRIVKEEFFKIIQIAVVMLWEAIRVILVLCTFCLSSIGHAQTDLINAFTFLNKIRYQKKSIERSIVDLREHKLFHSDFDLDCCPTQTELKTRLMGVNPQGILLELFFNDNFTQSFYETYCHPEMRDRPCQFIDPKYARYSRCIQQFSYVYALGRTFMRLQEQFRIDYIRIATGCKCQVFKQDAVEDFVEDFIND